MLHIATEMLPSLGKKAATIKKPIAELWKSLTLCQGECVQPKPHWQNVINQSRIWPRAVWLNCLGLYSYCCTTCKNCWSLLSSDMRWISTSDLMPNASIHISLPISASVSQGAVIWDLKFSRARICLNISGMIITAMISHPSWNYSLGPWFSRLRKHMHNGMQTLSVLHLSGTQAGRYYHTDWIPGALIQNLTSLRGNKSI